MKKLRNNLAKVLLEDSIWSDYVLVLDTNVLISYCGGYLQEKYPLITNKQLPGDFIYVINELHKMNKVKITSEVYNEFQAKLHRTIHEQLLKSDRPDKSTKRKNGKRKKKENIDQVDKEFKELMIDLKTNFKDTMIADIDNITINVNYDESTSQKVDEIYNDIKTNQTEEYNKHIKQKIKKMNLDKYVIYDKTTSNGTNDRQILGKCINLTEHHHVVLYSNDSDFMKFSHIIKDKYPNLRVFSNMSNFKYTQFVKPMAIEQEPMPILSGDKPVEELVIDAPVGSPLAPRTEEDKELSIAEIRAKNMKGIYGGWFNNNRWFKKIAITAVILFVISIIPAIVTDFDEQVIEEIKGQDVYIDHKNKPPVIIGDLQKGDVDIVLPSGVTIDVLSDSQPTTATTKPNSITGNVQPHITTHDTPGREPITHTIKILAGSSTNNDCDRFSPCLSPRIQYIKVGDTIEWINEDHTTHTIRDGKYKSVRVGQEWTLDIKPSGSVTFTFDEIGTVHYHSFTNPVVKGEINVT